MSKVKFANIFEFQKKSSIKAGEGKKVGKYPFYTSSQTSAKYLNTYQYNQTSLIFGTGGNASVHMSETPFSTSTDCLICNLTEEAKRQFETKYVYYFLFGNIWILEKGFKGAGLKHISKDYIGQIEIPIQPIELQQRIVRTLDFANELKKKRSQVINLLDEYLKSVFLEMFGDPVENQKGWEVRKFKDVSNIKIGPFGSLLHTSDYIHGGIPLVNPTHIIEKKILVDSKLTVDKTKYEELNAYHLKVGDVVLGRRGEMGRCGLVTENEDGFLCGTGSMFIRPNKTINSLFLVYFISTQSFKRSLEDRAIGITMKNLNAGTVQNMPTFVPPIELQNKFAQIVKETESLKQKMLVQSEELENQFQALMQKYFTFN